MTQCTTSWAASSLAWEPRCRSFTLGCGGARGRGHGWRRALGECARVSRRAAPSYPVASHYRTVGREKLRGCVASSFPRNSHGKIPLCMSPALEFCYPAYGVRMGLASRRREGKEVRHRSDCCDAGPAFWHGVETSEVCRRISPAPEPAPLQSAVSFRSFLQENTGSYHYSA